jgi:hypothetical protein
MALRETPDGRSADEMAHHWLNLLAAVTPTMIDPLF